MISLPEQRETRSGAALNQIDGAELEQRQKKENQKGLRKSKPRFRPHWGGETVHVHVLKRQVRFGETVNPQSDGHMGED